jgi:hypothetical protein
VVRRGNARARARCVSSRRRYSVESTRGNNHFVARVAVQQGRLYVLTAQAKSAEYDEIASELASIVSTFEVSSAGPKA